MKNKTESIKNNTKEYFIQVYCPMVKAATRILCYGNTTVGEVLDVASRNLGIEWKNKWLAATLGMQLLETDVIGADGKLSTEIPRHLLRWGHEPDYQPKKHRLHGDIVYLDSGQTGWWEIDSEIANELDKRGWSKNDFKIILICGLTGG